MGLLSTEVGYHSGLVGTAGFFSSLQDKNRVKVETDT